MKKRKSKLMTTKLDAGNVELNTAFFNNAMNVGGCGLAEEQQLTEPADNAANRLNYIDLIDKFIEDIYDLRKQSIKNEGEYSIGNLVFKEFRNLGYLDKLKDMKNELKSKELSLESIQENSGELEESLDSWYDNRNKSWANFYRQKAGVAAGDAIDTDNLDPWAMSITCCYKNCSPELLKEVLKRY